MNEPKYYVIGECPLNFYPGTLEESNGNAKIHVESEVMDFSSAAKWADAAVRTVNSEAWKFTIVESRDANVERFGH